MDIQLHNQWNDPYYDRTIYLIFMCLEYKDIDGTLGLGIGIMGFGITLVLKIGRDR